MVEQERDVCSTNSHLGHGCRVTSLSLAMAQSHLPAAVRCVFCEQPTWPLQVSPGRNSLVWPPLWPWILPLAQFPCGPTGGRCGICPSLGRMVLTAYFLSTLLQGPGE